MNNKILLLPIIGATTFFVLLFLFTKLFGPIPFSVNSVTTTKSDTFNVTGEGKVTVKPDTASVTAGIQAQSSTVKGAQDQINLVINKISQSLKQAGIDEKDIQTTNYSIHPSYDYSGSAQRITGYSASTNLLIKVRNIEKINEVIDIATNNGANQVGGVSFDVDDRTKWENEARTKAVDEAKRKAEEASKIAGFRLGKIINYSENFGGGIRPIPMMRALDASSKEVSTQLESGSTDITVVVTLSYQIL